MAFDGVVLHAVKTELTEKLLGGRVDKVYQPESDEIVLLIRNGGENYKLFLSADANYPRIHLTDESFKNPASPPLFCMLLRKHLGSGKITGIRQIKSDRILCICVETYNELGDLCEKSLYIEIMGRHSNIILVSEKGLVIDSIKRVDLTVSSKRQLLPGLFYETAPAQDKLDFLDYDSADLKEALLIKEDIRADKFAMETFLGVSPVVSREIAYRAFGTFQEILTSDNMSGRARLMTEAEAFFQDMKDGRFHPCIVSEQGMPKYFSCVELTQYREGFSTAYSDSVSGMVDTFYRRLHLKRKMNQRSHDLQKHLNSQMEKLEKKIGIHSQTLFDASDKEKYRLYGELITANMYRLKGGEKELEAENYYEGNQKIVIPLNENSSPAQNSQRYYKRYQKMKTAEEMAAKQLEKAKKELFYLESVQNSFAWITTQDEIDEIAEELAQAGYLKAKSGKKKKLAKTAYQEFVSSDGLPILVGKNNRQNDELSFKIARPRDLWLHVKTYPGSHTLVVTNGLAVPDTTLYEAAVLAAIHSKANTSGKVEIDYTEIKFVKKPPGAKPGMVTYSNFKTILVPPDVSVMERCGKKTK